MAKTKKVKKIDVNIIHLLRSSNLLYSNNFNHIFFDKCESGDPLINFLIKKIIYWLIENMMN